ncbi:hypothetical protein WMY93_003176 [Mugilogobius chulae]|uniref:MARVEL domain-containing protein n=1 Tax=Mugilogobius chulae TaxID=88201 RepID=A0AAW0PWQ5_9GOBI
MQLWCVYGPSWFAGLFLLLPRRLQVLLHQFCQRQEKAIMLEIGFSGFWTFLYFVSFCFLANQWSRTSPDMLPLNQGADAARAAIAFSFFSIITWAGLTVRAVQKYLLGTDMTLFTTEHMDGGAPSQPYPSNSPGGGTTETTETYQSPPFTENNAAPTYQVPIY